MATGCVLNLPEHGHLNATFPLVRELVSRGDRLIYFGTDPYRSAIEASCACFVPYPGEATQFDPPAHTGGLYSVMAYLIGIADRILPDLIARVAAERPDYLLIDSMCVWGRLVQQATGIPAVTLGSVFVPDDRRVSLEEMVMQAYGRAPREVVLAGIEALDTYLRVSQQLDRRHGTRSPNLVEFFANRQPLNVIFTSREFHLAGDAYDDSYEFVGPSIAPRAEAGGLAEAGLDVAADVPVIYLSLGTIFSDRADFFRAAFAALADGPWQVVASVGRHLREEALGPIPRNVTVRAFVPQLEVLTKASLCITHGGMNTTSEALWFGVPLLVFPQHGDQHLVASRVVECGAGLRMTPADVEPARLRELVTSVLADARFKQGAARLAASFRAAGGVRRAADAIGRYVERSASPPEVSVREAEEVRA